MHSTIRKIEDDDTLITTQTQTQIHNYILPFPKTGRHNKKIANTIDSKDENPYRAIIEFLASTCLIISKVFLDLKNANNKSYKKKL